MASTNINDLPSASTLTQSNTTSRLKNRKSVDLQDVAVVEMRLPRSASSTAQGIMISPNTSIPENSMCPASSPTTSAHSSPIKYCESNSMGCTFPGYASGSSPKLLRHLLDISTCGENTTESSSLSSSGSLEQQQQEDQVERPAKRPRLEITSPSNGKQARLNSFEPSDGRVSNITVVLSGYNQSKQSMPSLFRQESRKTLASQLSRTQLVSLPQLHIQGKTSVAQDQNHMSTKAGSQFWANSAPFKLNPATALDLSPNQASVTCPTLIEILNTNVASGSTASNPSLTPPITKVKLKELDLQEILQCRQLRHDIIFDENIMLRPNLEGNRGERKRDAADQYWLAVTRELQIGSRCNAHPFQPTSTTKELDAPLCASPILTTRLPSRIFSLVSELRDILLDLLAFNLDEGQGIVSGSIRRDPTDGNSILSKITDTLDPSYITQQAQDGLLDVSSFADFLASTIKSRCAPMRDELVENMRKTLVQGGRSGDMVQVSAGLRRCFELLELMKLDIANHQLRLLRPYLIESAAEYELKSFMASIEENKKKGVFEGLDKTKKWFCAAKTRSFDSARGLQTKDRNNLYAISEGILELLFRPDSPSINTGCSKIHHYPLALSQHQIPETLQLDLMRLELFHGDATNLCIVYLLLLLFRKLRVSYRQPPPDTEQIAMMRKEIWVLMSGISSSGGSECRNLSSIPNGYHKMKSNRWKEGMKDVLLQIARRAAEKNEECDGIPSQATISMLTAWMETNVKPDSTLFMLVIRRLREVLLHLVTLNLNEDRPAMKSTTKPLFPSPWSSPSKAATSLVDAAIAKNGLNDLSAEVQLLSRRLATLIAFHGKVYGSLYAGMTVSQPSHHFPSSFLQFTACSSGRIIDGEPIPY